MATIPVDFQIRRSVNDTFYIYDTDITLTQADVPYMPPKAGAYVPPSTQHLVVMADVIRIGSFLWNPGRDIRLYARELYFENGAHVCVAGSDPAPAGDFRPGNLPQQDTKAGANGAHGGDAGDGVAAGNIVIDAETIYGGDAAFHGQTAQATQLFFQPWVAELLARLVSAPLRNVKPGVLGDFKTDKFAYKEMKLASTGTAALTAGQPSLTLAGYRIPLTLALPDLVLEGKLLYSGMSCTCKVRGGFAVTAVLNVSLHNHSAEFVSKPELAHVALSGSYKLPIGDWGSDFAAEELQAVMAHALGNLLHEPVRNGLNRMATELQQKLQQTPFALLDAQGGRGGRGQDGHAGVRGEKGEAGRDNTSYIHYLSYDQEVPTPPQDAIGHQGKKGGKGGNAGHSGAGAQGGRISIGYVKQCLAPLQVFTAGGYGGAAAPAGARGQGGEGGDGGTYQVRYAFKTGVGYIETAPSGPGGDAGDAADFQGAPGKPGDASSLSVNGAELGRNAKLAYADIAPAFDFEYLMLARHIADFAWLNAREPVAFERAGQSYVWLANLTRPFTVKGAVFAGLSAEDIKARAALYEYALTHMNWLALGMDFYGNVPDWVPVMTLAWLEKRINELLATGDAVEAQLRVYFDEQSKEDDKRAAIDGVRKNLDGDLSKLQGEAAKIEERLATLEAEITTFNDALVDQQAVIQRAEAAFKRWIEEQMCDLETVLDVVKCIIAVGTGIASVVGAVKGVQEFLQATGDLGKKFKNVIEKVEEVGSSIQEIRETYGRIKDNVTDDSPDAAKLLADKDDFKAFIKEYVDKSPAAKTLRNEINNFFALNERRNARVLEYNTVFTGKLQVLADYAQRSARTQLLASQMAAARDPHRIAYVTFMQAAYDDVRQALVRKLYEYSRAYRFWTLKDVQFDTSDLNMAFFHNTFLKLRDDVAAYSEHEDTNIFQPFTQEIVVTAADFPAEFDRLRTLKKLIFALDVTRCMDYGFVDVSHVIATKVEIVLPQVTTGVVMLNLIHNGQSGLLPKVNQPATARRFVHDPRAVFYKIDHVNPVNTAGGLIGSSEQGYAGLSPFTTWTLDFSSRGNTLDVAAITEVRLRFTGTAKGPGIRHKALFARAG